MHCSEARQRGRRQDCARGSSRRPRTGRSPPPSDHGRGHRLLSPPRLPPGDDAGDLRRGRHQRRRALSLFRLARPRSSAPSPKTSAARATTPSCARPRARRHSTALCLIARDFFEKFADGDGALIADIFAEAIRDDAIAAPLREDRRAQRRAVRRARSKPRRRAAKSTQHSTPEDDRQHLVCSH